MASSPKSVSLFLGREALAPGPRAGELGRTRGEEGGGEPLGVQAGFHK